MLYLFVIAVAIYLINNIPKIRSEISEILTETHKYSGIHPESYGLFYTNLQLAIEYPDDSRYIEKAVYHLNEIPLYMSPVEHEVQSELAMLGEKLKNAFKK